MLLLLLFYFLNRGDLSFNFSSQAQPTCSGQNTQLQLQGQPLWLPCCRGTWQIFQHADTHQCTPVSNAPSNAPFSQLITFQARKVPTSRQNRQKNLRKSFLLQASESSSGLNNSPQQQWGRLPQTEENKENKTSAFTLISSYRELF